MILTADYHTHTVFSHGKGNILDNANVAKNKGLIQVGISDHGFSHPAFGLSTRKLPKMRKLCDEASSLTKVEVLLGIESNIIGVDGTTDLNPKNYDYFDIFFSIFVNNIDFIQKVKTVIDIPSINWYKFIDKKLSS